jgi:hypothetical protein
MPHHTRSGLLRRSALTLCLLGALPLSVLAQIRRPEPVPVGRGGPKAAVPKTRTELFIMAGTQGLSADNATGSSMPIGVIGFRKQVRYDWLFLGGMADAGQTTIDGDLFPYERRAIGDTTQFVSVDGSATMVAARLTAEAMLPAGESERFRYGGGLNVGVYSVQPSPAAGADAGSFIAPTFGLSAMGAVDITSRFGAMASIAFTQFLGFDREKLRPSDPALAAPVFETPFTPPPAAKESFGGVRLMVGLTYRLGVKSVTGGTK